LSNQAFLENLPRVFGGPAISIIEFNSDKWSFCNFFWNCAIVQICQNLLQKCCAIQRWYQNCNAIRSFKILLLLFSGRKRVKISTCQYFCKLQNSLFLKTAILPMLHHAEIVVIANDVVDNIEAQANFIKLDQIRVVFSCFVIWQNANHINCQLPAWLASYQLLRL